MRWRFFYICAMNVIALTFTLESIMSRLEELLAQQEQLTAAIEDAKSEQRKEDLKTVRNLCKAHGFTATMLKGYLAKGRILKANSEK
jgi:DNA-binding protein H-NS